MTMFFVSWKLAFWVHDPCPDVGKIDNYGNPLRTGCLVNHGHYEYTLQSKEFATKEEAEQFIKNAPQNTKDFEIKEAI